MQEPIEINQQLFNECRKRKPNHEQVKKLLKEGANPNQQYEDGFNALHWVCYNTFFEQSGFWQQTSRVQEYPADIALVKLLLDHGANPDIKRRDVSCLGTLCEKKNPELAIIRLFLEKGSDPKDLRLLCSNYPWQQSAMQGAPEALFLDALFCSDLTGIQTLSNNKNKCPAQIKTLLSCMKENNGQNLEAIKSCMWDNLTLKAQPTAEKAGSYPRFLLLKPVEAHDILEKTLKKFAPGANLQNSSWSDYIMEQWNSCDAYTQAWDGAAIALAGVSLLLCITAAITLQPAFLALAAGLFGAVAGILLANHVVLPALNACTENSFSL